MCLFTERVKVKQRYKNWECHVRAKTTYFVIWHQRRLRKLEGKSRSPFEQQDRADFCGRDTEHTTAQGVCQCISALAFFVRCVRIRIDQDWCQLNKDYQIRLVLACHQCQRKSNCWNDCNIFLLVGLYIIVGKKSQIRLRILEQIGLNKESERTDRRSES